MLVTDPIADMLTRIRNANSARKEEVEVPYSRIRWEIAKILRDEGYITDFAVAPTTPGKAELTITLKYFEGQPVIERIERVGNYAARLVFDDGHATGLYTWAYLRQLGEAG